MKQNFKILKCFIYICLAFGMFFGCEKDLYTEAQNAHYKKQIRTKYLSEKEKNSLISIMNKKIQSKEKFNILSKGRSSMRTSEGTIDYSKILEVIDTLGVKNYTFKVLNHPESDDKTFFNFIVNVKDSTNYSFHLFKYKMSDEFFVDLNNGVKKIHEFQGIVTNYNIDTANPCNEEIPITDPPIIIPISGAAGAGGGGGGGAGGFDFPEFTENGNSGCWSFFLVKCCEGVHFGEEAGCDCAAGNGNIGATFLIDRCNGNGIQLLREMSDPCNPDGVIGVLDDGPVTEPCDKLANLFSPDLPNLVSPPFTANNIKSQTEWLMTKAGLATEYGVEVEKRLNASGDGFRYPTNRVFSPDQYSVKLNTSSNFIGGVHSHPKDSYPLPSFTDVKWLKECYNDAFSNNRKKDVFASIVVKQNDGTIAVYTLLVNDIEKLNNEVTARLASLDATKFPTEDKKLKEIDRQQAELFDKSNGNLEKSFLDQFSAFGIDLYKASDNTLQNWDKLELVSNSISGNTVQTTPCN
jgi:hypothetical protein